MKTYEIPEISVISVASEAVANDLPVAQSNQGWDD